MKKYSFLLAWVLSILAFNRANAQLNLSIGGFTINANGYSSDTILTKAIGAMPVVGAPPGTTEDTWGIFQITNILSGATTVFTDNLGTEYWAFMYGSYDVSPPIAAGGLLIFDSTNIHIDIYKKSIADVGDALWQGVYNQGTSGRTGYAAYNGITNPGELVFSAVASGDFTSTYQAAGGHTTSSGELAVTYNTMFATPAGTVMTNLSSTIGGLTTGVPADWTDKFDGPTAGAVVAVPEPSTFGVIAGLSIIGLVAIRRIRTKAAAV